MSRMDPEDARQGRKGTPVLRVLIIALVLAVIAGAGMAIYGRMMPDQTLPDGGQAAGTGTGAATTDTAPSGTGTTVTPQSSGSTSGGTTQN